MSGEEGAFHSSVERELDFDTNPQVGIAVLTLPCPRTNPTMQHISGFPNIGASTFPPARWDEHRHQWGTAECMARPVRGRQSTLIWSFHSEMSLAEMFPH